MRYLLPEGRLLADKSQSACPNWKPEWNART
jgi:hypothetical protein